MVFSMVYFTGREAVGSMGDVVARRLPLTTAISGLISDSLTLHQFVVDSLPFFEGFSPGSPVFLPQQKINVPKFQFDHGRGPQIYQLITVMCYPRKTKLV
jgi:hypothetical protein